MSCFEADFSTTTSAFNTYWVAVSLKPTECNISIRPGYRKPLPYNARMAEPDGTADQQEGQLEKREKDEPSSPQRACDTGDREICERCGKAEMYRMHAVWRCPECGFKTDCCGW